MKSVATLLALAILKISLWITLAICLVIIATHNSDVVRRETYEAAEDARGAWAQELQYRYIWKQADAINPMSGVPYVLLFTVASLAAIHSLDLVRYRLDAILAAIETSPVATAEALRKAAKVNSQAKPVAAPPLPEPALTQEGHADGLVVSPETWAKPEENPTAAPAVAGTRAMRAKQ